MRERLLASFLTLVVFCVSSCSNDSAVAPIAVSRRPAHQALNPDQVIQGLLADAKAAEPEIAALRKARFSIAEETTIPVGPDRVYSREFAKKYTAYRMIEVETFRSRTRDPDAAKPIAEIFLKAIAETSANRSDLQTSQLLALGKAAVMAGSKDSLVESYIASYTITPNTPVEIHALRKSLEEAWKRMPDEDYGSACSVVLASRIVAMDELTKLTKEGVDKVPPLVQEGHRKELTGTLVLHLERHPKPEHWRLALETFDSLSSAFELQLQASIRREVLASPDIVPWYKLLIASRGLMREAWDARGSGFASTVTDVGWKSFQEKTEQVRQLLLLAWKLQPDSPEAATEMIEMANIGAEREWTARQWFQQAVATHFDYPRTYQMYCRSLQPKWGGSHISLIRFARECVESRRHDTCVPNEGLSALWLVQGEIGFERSVMSDPDARSTINAYASQMLDAMKKKQSLSYYSQWAGPVLNWLVLAGDYPLAKNWLENCGVEISPVSLQACGNRLSRLRQTIAACTGSGSEVAIPLVTALYGPQIPSADQLPKLRQSLATVRERDTSELTTSLCREIELVLDQYDQFEAGKWTEFPCDKNMTGWQHVVADEFTEINETTFAMSSTKGSQVSPVARFKPPYILEVEVQRYDPLGKRPNSDSCMMVGIDDVHAVRATSEPLVICSSDLGAVGLIEGFDILHQGGFVQAEKRLITMKVWPGEVGCAADGFIFGQAPITGPMATRLGLGTRWLFQKPTACRFHGFRIRKMPYPAVIPVPADEMDDFGQTVIDFDPEDADGYLFKAQGLIAEKNLAAAIETLEAGLQRAKHLAGIRSQLAFLYYLAGRLADSAHLCRISLAWAPLPRDTAVLSMILSSSSDTRLKDPAEALRLAGGTMPDTYWLGAIALASAQAANGDFQNAKITIQRAEPLAPDDDARKMIQQSAEIISQGRVPILEDKSKPASTPPATHEKPSEQTPAAPAGNAQ